MGQTFQKAKRTVEDKFNKFVLKKGKKKDGSMEEPTGSRNKEYIQSVFENLLYLFRSKSTKLRGVPRNIERIGICCFEGKKASCYTVGT